MGDEATIDVHPGNQGAAEGWNGADGQHWVDHADTYHRSLADHTPALLDAAAIDRADVVLDVGCGSGHLTIEAGRRAQDGRAVGVDVSGLLVRDARLRAATSDVRNVEFLLGDAQIHRFESGSFDLVLSRTGTMFFSDQIAAFTNLAAAVRSGGRLAVLVWQAIGANEWFAEINDALDAGRPPVRPPTGAPGPFAFAEPAHARTVLDAAGWTDIEIEAHCGPMWFGADPDTAFEFLSTQGFSNFRLGGLDAARREAALDALRSTLHAHHGADGVTYDSAVWIIRARRR